MSLNKSSLSKQSNKEVRILVTDEDYESWYRDRYDFSMFTEEQIKNAIQDDRPKNYPCIPFIPDDSYQVFYLGEELIESLFRILCTWQNDQCI